MACADAMKESFWESYFRRELYVPQLSSSSSPLSFTLCVSLSLSLSRSVFILLFMPRCHKSMNGTA